MDILNLTQHPATAAQIKAGVFDYANLLTLKKLINFETLPTISILQDRADSLVNIASHDGCDAAMIAGASYFMPVLEKALSKAGIKVIYAFSKRVSSEVILPDGSVKKVSVFVHEGFIEV